jgi:hypothetical protein
VKRIPLSKDKFSQDLSPRLCDLSDLRQNTSKAKAAMLCLKVLWLLFSGRVLSSGMTGSPRPELIEIIIDSSLSGTSATESSFSRRRSLAFRSSAKNFLSLESTQRSSIIRHLRKSLCFHGKTLLGMMTSYYSFGLDIRREYTVCLIPRGSRHGR